MKPKICSMHHLNLQQSPRALLCAAMWFPLFARNKGGGASCERQAGMKFGDNKGVITYSQHPFMSPLWVKIYGT
jgi:hypothetical protein